MQYVLLLAFYSIIVYIIIIKQESKKLIMKAWGNAMPVSPVDEERFQDACHKILLEEQEGKMESARCRKKPYMPSSNIFMSRMPGIRKCALEIMLLIFSAKKKSLKSKPEILTETKAVTHIGKKGNAYLYQMPEEI